MEAMYRSFVIRKCRIQSATRFLQDAKKGRTNTVPGTARVHGTVLMYQSVVYPFFHVHVNFSDLFQIVDFVGTFGEYY
jgi:hypothetical protein